MITRHTSRSHSAKLGPRTILFFTSSSGCTSGSVYAAPNRTSAFECYFGWFIDETLSSLLVRYRLFLLFFLCPSYRMHRERRSRSPTAFILAAQPSPRSLLFLFLFLSTLFSLYIVIPSDKPLSFPPFTSSLGQDRSTAYFDVWPVLKSEKRKEKREEENESERIEGNDKFAKGKRW